MKRRPWGLVLLALGLLALAAGCQSWERALGDYDPRLKPEQRAYEEALEPNLVRGQLHSGPATELLVTALPLTASVRRAMAVRQAQAQGLPPDQAQALLEAAQQEAGKGLEVALALHTPERERADLAARSPSWRVWLRQGAAQVGASDLRQVRERSGLQEALYPFWGPWESLWRARFPAPAKGEAMLLISGAPGQLELPLKLD